MSYTPNLITQIEKGDFTSIGTGLTVINTAFGVNFVKAGGGASHSVAGLYKTAPSPPYTITSCMSLNGNSPLVRFNINGIGWSNGTAYVLFYTISDGGGTTPGAMKIGVGKYTNSTTFSADYFQDNASYLAGDKIWLQIVDNNTNRLCNYSKDGINFQNLHSVGRTDFLTATRVGMFINPYDAAMNITYLSWTGA